jgi:hypothetical protein
LELTGEELELNQKIIRDALQRRPQLVGN